jgi:predicted small lipoprotein YifL
MRHYRTRHLSRCALLLLALGAAMAGCGQKGPLYHPPEEPKGLTESAR